MILFCLRGGWKYTKENNFLGSQMNRIKTDQKYPEILESCDITPIFKLKESRNDFKNYRGVFRVYLEAY